VEQPQQHQQADSHLGNDGVADQRVDRVLIPERTAQLQRHQGGEYGDAVEHAHGDGNPAHKSRFEIDEPPFLIAVECGCLMVLQVALTADHHGLESAL
jgi:hypothetical protein